MLERAGPGPEGSGTITGIFTVLVDGDDHNEPVADAVRGILDGHIVMERAIAERGRYPAVNVLKSISRTMPRACDPAFLPVIQRARQIMATYSDMEELIRLGAYRPGSSPDVDEAIALQKPLDQFPRPGQERGDVSVVRLPDAGTDPRCRSAARRGLNRYAVVDYPPMNGNPGRLGNRKLTILLQCPRAERSGGVCGRQSNVPYEASIRGFGGVCSR